MQRLLPALLALLAFVSTPPPGAGGELTVVTTSTIQEAGPRTGASGARFFNIEGKNNGRYASFGVLEFKVPTDEGAKAKSLTLTLTQSVARFSKNGKVKVYLSEDAKTAADALKFKGGDGLEDQLKPLTPVGEYAFEKAETGKTERVGLKLDSKALDTFRKQVADNGMVRLVLAPGDGDVAATYFGVEGEDPAQRPKLVLETAP